ncbi:MAG TPA: oligosaccharide flippase family protein [Chloroflexota bacterium]|nr:oligosaccharide flippase family protein [Chloroflexota bacterium]
MIPWGLFRRVGTVRLDPVSRQWATVAGGNLARLGLGFLASVLIARALGPADFGIFAVLAAISNIVGAVADFGLTDAAVKRIASALADDPDTARLRAGAFVWLRLGTTVVIVLTGCLIALLLPASRLPRADLRNLLLLALLGVAATALSGIVAALLQASQHFGRLTIVGFSNAGLTALFAAILFLVGQLNLLSALVVLGIGTSLISCAVGARLLPNHGFPAPPKRAAFRDEARELFRFGRWLGVSNAFAMLTAQLDVLLLGHWVPPASVGVYALALNLATKVDIVNSSLYTVLLPTVSSLAGPGAVRRYIRRGVLRSALIAVALLPLLVLVGPFVTVFYGSAYQGAIPLFQKLLGVVILDVVATPLILLAYHYNRPRLLAGADALRAGTLALTGVALIPSLGPNGAVAGKFVARLVGASVTVGLLARQPPARPAAPGPTRRSAPS